MTSSSSSAAPLPDGDWAAPHATAALDATVVVPGSKSLTNRYLVLAALADGPVTLRGALRSRDTTLMAESLRALGAGINDDGPDWGISPAAFTSGAEVDCGLAGTVMRFVPPIAALANGAVRFDGDAGARVRPMAPVLLALRALGVEVTDDGEPGFLPFTVTGSGAVRGGHVDVDASASSQFVSALLLAGARYEQGIEVRHIGPSLPSLPHIEMTVAVLREFGIEVDDSRPDIWSVAPGPVRARDVVVEPDLSNASPFLAAALVAGGTVRVPGWPSSSTQPGAQVPEIFTALGGSAELSDGVLTVRGTGEIHGADLDLHAVGELTPTIAALMTLADSPSRVRGVAHLRGHETDRLAALATEITKLGGQCEQTADGLVITPRPLHGGRWLSYHDHRMATAGSILGLRVPGIVVENVATTGKTLPDFTDQWLGMLGR